MLKRFDGGFVSCSATPSRSRAAATRWRFAAAMAGVALLTGTLLGAGTLTASASAGADSSTALQADDTLPAPDNPAMDMVAAMQPSWNVGNTMDAIPDETSWGNPLITKQPSPARLPDLAI